MLYILIIFSITIFLISFYTLGQDLFQPSCLVAASYIISTLCAYINQGIWNYSLHFETVIIIFSGLIVFYIINLIIYLSKTKISIKQIKRKAYESKKNIVIDDTIFIFVIIIQLFAVLIYYKDVLRISGGGSISVMMSVFRMATSYGDESISVLAGQLSKISLIFAEVFIFIFLNNAIFEKIKGNKRYLIPAMIYVIQALLTGGRFNILVVVFSALIVYNIFWHQKYGWKRTLQFKLLMRIVIIICILFTAFYWGRILVGRQNDDNLITYLASYAGGSIILLDMYIENPFPETKFWCEETFFALIKDLRQLGLLDEQNNIIHLEFRSCNGIIIGNVYTAFRRAIHDFGFLGMIVLQVIWSAVMSYWYKRIKYGSNRFNELAYAMTTYPLFLHSINDYFYSDIISFGYILTLVMTYIIFRFVTKIKLNRKVIFKMGS